MLRLLALALVVATAALALPTAANAVIVPQRSIAGVTLGMSQSEVENLLGEPSSVNRDTSDFGPFVELVYRRQRLRVFLQGEEEVTRVSTTSRSERTSRRVGVGSSERSVKRNVRRVRCRTFFRFRSCVVGREAAGRTVTVFDIRRGRVSRVTLGIVID